MSRFPKRTVAPGLGNRSWALAVGLAACALLSCSETSLNVAPIIDLSRASGARSASERPAPVNVAQAPDGMYTVQMGDTLFHIATMFHCATRDLARWNGLDETAAIQAGQRLRVRDPGAGALPAAAASVPPPAADAEAPAEVHAVPLAATPMVETHALDSAPLGPGAAPNTEASNGAATSAPAGGALSAAPGTSSTWVWPVDGRVLVRFDPVRGKGIDIATDEDAQVRAVADGEVSYTGSPMDYGNLVILTHANGLRTVYAHNKTLLAKQGQTVTRGQVIATAGKTSVAAPVLHFEVRLKGVPVDPLDYLPVR
jgi:lipoprotein NlpD